MMDLPDNHVEVARDLLRDPRFAMKVLDVWSGHRDFVVERISSVEPNDRRATAKLLRSLATAIDIKKE